MRESKRIIDTVTSPFQQSASVWADSLWKRTQNKVAIFSILRVNDRVLWFSQLVDTSGSSQG